MSSESRFRTTPSRACIAVSLLVLASGCVSEAQTLSTSNVKTEYGGELEVAVPALVQYSSSFQFHSRITGNNSTDLAFPTSGRIDTLAVVEGQPVQAGQVLATLDAPQLLGTLEQANAAVATAEVELDTLGQEYARAKTLLERNVLSRQDYTLIKRDHQIAKQQLNNARASASQVRNNLDDLNLVAPESGLITRIHNRQGGFLQAGEPLLKLDSVSRQKAVFSVPEHVAVQLRNGDEFELYIAALERKTGAVVVEKSPPAGSASPLHEVTLQLTDADVSLVGLRALLEFRSQPTVAHEVDYRAIRYAADQTPYIVEAAQPLKITPIRVLTVRNNAAIFTAETDLQHALVTGSDFTLPLNLAYSER